MKLQVSFCPQWKETQFTFYISTEHTKQDDLKKTHTQIHCGQVIYILLSCSFRLKEKKVGKTTRPFSSIQFCSVPQLCPTLCDPMNSSMPGLPVHHPLPEFTQTHVHQVGDATQPSHPLSSPSPPALNLSQHQGLFQ